MNLNKDDLISELVIDSIITSEQLNYSTIQTIKGIGPFG